MRVCVFCKTRYQKGSGVTFHKFPTDSTRKLWLQNMKIDIWSPRANDHLCSKHFTDDCFIKHAARTALKSGSVPKFFSDSTLFSEQARPANDGCHDQNDNKMILETVSHSITDPSVDEFARDVKVTPTLCASAEMKTKFNVDQEFIKQEFRSSGVIKREFTLFTEQARPANDGCHGQNDNKMILETFSHSFIDPCVDELNENESARDVKVTPTLYASAGMKRKFNVDQEFINPEFRSSGVIKGEPSTSGIQKKPRSSHEVCKIIKHDHHYENTPKSSTKIIQRVKKALKMSRYRVKVLSQHVKRLKNSVSCLKSVITNLKKKKLQLCR